MKRFLNNIRGWLAKTGFKGPAATEKRTNPSLFENLEQAVSAPVVHPVHYSRPKTKIIAVKAGDTLFALAQAHNATVQAIVQANGLNPQVTLRAGQSLEIPLAAETPVPQPIQPNRPMMVRVGRHDTLTSIARRVGLPPETLARKNKLPPSNQLVAGQWLFVPAAKLPPAAASKLQPVAPPPEPALPSTPPPPRQPITLPSPPPVAPKTPPVVVKPSPSLKKPVFPADSVRGIYVPYHAMGTIAQQQHLLKFAEKAEFSALVLDFKDNWGHLSYAVPSILAAESGAARLAGTGMVDFLSALHAHKIRPIARIVAFKDNLVAQTHPTLAVALTHQPELWRDDAGMAWLDPTQEAVWAYLIDVAVAAARLGFAEVQFDGLHFPVAGLNGRPRLAGPHTAATRLNTIAAFLSAVRGQLAAWPVQISTTLRPFACWQQNDGLLGQQIERMSPYVDVLCPLLFPTLLTSVKSAATSELIRAGTEKAVSRTNAQIRPWLHDISGALIEISAQIQGAFAGGAAGFMVWNAEGTYSESAYDFRQV